MIRRKIKDKSMRRVNDYRTSQFFARMLSIFGWAFMIVWLVVGLRYGITFGREIHAALVTFVWGGAPLSLVNLFLVMWLLALVMFGFLFVVAGQGMRAVFEMANASKQLVLLTEEDMRTRRGESAVLDLSPEESALDEIAKVTENAEQVERAADEAPIDRTLG